MQSITVRVAYLATGLPERITTRTLSLVTLAFINRLLQCAVGQYSRIRIGRGALRSLKVLKIAIGR